MKITTKTQRNVYLRFVSLVKDHGIGFKDYQKLINVYV